MWLWPTCLKWKSKAIRLVSHVARHVHRIGCTRQLVECLKPVFGRAFYWAVATRAALGSEWQERRNQRRSGRAIQFCGVTKPGCRNGAANWAEWSGVPFGCAGCLGASQSAGFLNHQI